MSVSGSNESPDGQVRPEPPQSDLTGNSAADTSRSDGCRERDDDLTCEFSPAVPAESNILSGSSIGRTDATIDVVIDKNAAESSDYDVRTVDPDNVRNSGTRQTARDAPGLLDYQLLSEIEHHHQKRLGVRLFKG